MKKIYYQWKDIHGAVIDIARQLQKDNWRPDYIVGLTRGGLIPAVMLSQFLEVPCETLKVSLRDSGDIDTKTNPYIGRIYFGGQLAPYAPYVEFGTGSGFATDPSFVQYASQFIKGPGRNADPQPFLIPAFVFHKKIFLNDIRKIAKKISK